MRRVYYFTPPDHALENLQKKRLKVSRFSECNDPFELAAFNLKNKGFRSRFKQWLKDTDSKNGLLCFCRSWRNPVVWAHYAKNHTGICYGFDVDPEVFVDVRYVSERLFPGITNKNFFDHVGEDQMVDLFATKFIHWAYEEEVRLLVTFINPVLPNKLNFQEFTASMSLKQVIVGPRSNITVANVERTVKDGGVEVFQSRLAFQSYKVVRQDNKSMW